MGQRTTGIMPLVVAGTMLATLIGCSGSGPTASVLPASLFAEKELEFECPESSESCSHTGVAVNRSSVGCADNVSGVTELLDDEGEVLATDEWSLDPNRIIRPDEQFEFEGCCFRFINVMDSWNHKTDLSWTDVPCDGDA